MQKNSTIPLVVAIDQEGGTVDRLASLDGPRPSATSIGATNDPNRAMAEGIQDAQDLSYYGFNLNLAPVVDVNNVFNDQLYLRTFGNNPTIVTQMAAAYLRGLQQSGKVMGTIKTDLLPKPSTSFCTAGGSSWVRRSLMASGW